MFGRETVWFFDLDNTLHDASHAAFGPTNRAMTEYIVEHLRMGFDEASALRQHYWHHYGATLLGLVRHHGVRAAHFLEQTHRLPELEARLRTSAHDRAVLRRLRGRKFILTNAPRAYALRVLNTLGLTGLFDGILSIEDMTMFGEHRPKPDARMFRHVMARLKVRPQRCVLVEDTLAHQKAAHRLGMRTVWMRRYLDGKFKGTLRDGINSGRRQAKVGVHPCHMPPYVYARIFSLKTLRALR
ncbi:pyrimidine 5'-nucleotidase [uncultured Piscinibacter sp.]|uniref:pyrimidine 5'-nucleotidase n=1 Tax=uncultured Piscinibacter sp. TaxID=1131835 RepID=UPI002627A80E|nr:pyrimidine 5'-nucleotidase [uncultured Piscinibacter sp.]